MCGCMYMSVCLQDGSPNPTLEAGTIISPILLLGKLRLQLVKNLSLKCLSLVYQIPKPSLAHPVGGAELMHRQPLPPPPAPHRQFVFLHHRGFVSRDQHLEAGISDLCKAAR